MKNTEVLKKALEKAEKNGWKYFGFGEEYLGTPPSWRVAGRESAPVIFVSHGNAGPDDDEVYIYYEALIFRDDFAIAIWGKEMTDIGLYIHQPGYHDDDEGYYRPKFLEAFQYHLQQMVIEEDPIQYLAKFI